MSGDDDDLNDLLGPEPIKPEEPTENLVDAAPVSPPPVSEGRALLERSRSYPVNRAAKKLTPERLIQLLNNITEMPVTSDAVARAGISTTTLKYWLQKSFEGQPGDGFDVKLPDDDEDDEPVRFHEAWDMAMVAGVEKVERVAMQRATGYLEPQVYRGRVQYKYDPDKLRTARELGLEEYVPENYLLDERGVPIPETVEKMDPDLAMFILKTRKADVYGQKAQVDVNVKGGVLVVSQQVKDPVDLNKIEQNYRMGSRPSVTFEDGEDE